MMRNRLWVTILAVTLTTGLLASSLPTISAGTPSAPCPPTGKFVNIDVMGVEMGPYEIKSYTYSAASGTYMFTHEPDDTDGMGLSEKILPAIKEGKPVDIHFTSCKQTGMGMFKKHTVWLSLGMITDVSETAGDDDDFPTEKVTGTFTEIERMTETSKKGDR